MIIELIIFSLINLILLFITAKVSYKLNLVDIPNKRKIHSDPTVFTGGLAIAIALVISIPLVDVKNYNLNLIFSMGFLTSLIGLIDDKFQLNVGGKLSLQILPIIYLMIFQNLYLFDLGEFNYFKLELGAFGVPFTLLCILLLINSFNYFDGMNGTLSFATISTFLILYFLISDKDLLMFLNLVIISLIIFLLFNFSLLKLPRVFLGDSGSLLIGFIVSFTLIEIANKNLVHPILLAWSIAVFVYEFLSINIIRLKNNQKIFSPAKDHLHHLLFFKTNSISLTNFFIILINVLFFFTGYLCFVLIHPLVSLILFPIMFIIYLLLRIELQILNK